MLQVDRRGGRLHENNIGHLRVGATAMFVCADRTFESTPSRCSSARPSRPAEAAAEGDRGPAPPSRRPAAAGGQRRNESEEEAEARADDPAAVHTGLPVERGRGVQSRRQPKRPTWPARVRPRRAAPLSMVTLNTASSMSFCASPGRLGVGVLAAVRMAGARRRPCAGGDGRRPDRDQGGRVGGRRAPARSLSRCATNVSKASGDSCLSTSRSSQLARASASADRCA